MTWAGQRKLQYTAGVVGFLVIVGFFVLRSVFHQIPTCYDGKKNGDETGQDCGGNCALYCINELSDPKIRWVRTFEVTPGVVNAVAYIEHSHPGAAARIVNYTFKIYDENNALIAERSGSTFLGLLGQSAIVETRIQVGNATPALARFSFTAPIAWEKVPQDFSAVAIKTDRNILQDFTGGTRVAATLDNQSSYSFNNLDAVAILYDAEGNAVTASNALVPSLDAKSTQVVYFTWPYILTSKVVQTEIIPRFNPFTARGL